MNTGRIGRALPLFVTVFGWSVAAHAQTAGFAADRFDPAESGSDWFAGESLDLRGHLRPAAGLVLDWAHDPLEIRSSTGASENALIRDSFYAHLGGSLILWNRLRVGLNVPVALYQDAHSGNIDGEVFTPSSGAAFGDVRLGADVRIVGEYGGPVTVAAGAEVYLPTGSRSAFTSDGSFRLAPRVLVAGRLGPFVYAARGGVLLRSNDELGTTQEGSELTFTAEAGLELFADRLVVGPEVFGSTTLNGAAFDRAETPLEGLLSAHLRLTRDVRVGAAIGAGLTSGIGEPTSRVLGMVEFAPPFEKPRPPPAVIACGIDEVRTENGCAPADRDHDGIADGVDACPDIPGAPSPDMKRNGCPPPPPPPDQDGDGVPDADDACPSVRGVATADRKTNGCPPDQDEDGVPDAEDACPRDAGPRSDDVKKNGCPRAVLVEKEIRITDQIQFRTGRAEIDPASDDTLSAVAEVLTAHPELGRVSIEGHTDNRGSATLNKRLSTARATAVLQWLVNHGIPRERLEARGFGPQRPLMANDTDEGRRLNRRVEFHGIDAPAPPARTANPSRTERK